MTVKISGTKKEYKNIKNKKILRRMNFLQNFPLKSYFP